MSGKKFLAGHRAVRAGAAAVAVIITMASCTSGAPTGGSNGPRGAVLRIGLAADPGNLDPTLSSTLASSQLYPAFCESLYGEYHPSEIRPILASGPPQFGADRLSVRIPIRSGAKFADGTPVDADAVRFSLERHMSLPGSQRLNELDAVAGVRAVDPTTVELNLKYPLAEGVLLTNLAARAGTIVSPKAADELGPDGFNQAPVCSGPFKFEGRVAQNNVTLVKDPNYHDAANVHLNRIEYRIITDSAVRLTNLRSGDLDIVERISPADLPTLAVDPKLKVERFPGLGHLNLIFNIGNTDGAENPPRQRTDPLASNPDIRKALAMSIDRDTLNKIVYGDQYAPACSFVAEHTSYSTPTNSRCPGFDPQAAKDLLASTGVALPFKVELLMNQNPEMRRLGELMQQMAAQAGFEVTLNVQESTSAAQATNSGRFEIYFNSFTGTIDPDMNVSRFFQRGAPSNGGKFLHPELDQLLIEARSESDPAKRRDLYDQIHTIITDNTATIYLLRPANIIVYNTRVVDLEYRATGTVIPNTASLNDN